MIKFYAAKSAPGSDLTALDNFKTGAWIFAESPTSKEVEQLRDDFNLDEGFLTDALDFYEVPRLEIEDDITYIFTRVPHRDEKNRSQTTPLMIALGPAFIITISPQPLDFLNKLIAKPAGVDPARKIDLLLKILSQIVTSYDNFLFDINRSLQHKNIQLEESHSINNKDIIEFLNLEKILDDFIAALQPTKIILGGLSSGKYLNLSENDKDSAGDLLTSLNQLIVSCQSNLRMIVNIRNAYSTIMTNNLNRIIKILTALTIILSVPTIIAAFYGMNVVLPFGRSPFAFLGVAISTLIAMGIVLAVFIKNRWL